MVPTRPTTSPLERTDAQLAEAIAERLGTFLAARRGELHRIAPEVLQLVDLLEQFVRGGKLLRPRFCLWGGAATRELTEADTEDLVTLGAAIELVQAAALVHDDVMDHSLTRRGRPTVHVAVADRHREHGLRGSAPDFGKAVATVLGDLALVWSEQMASGVDGPLTRTEGVAGRARAEFDALRTEVMSGQYLDILHQAGGYTSAADPHQAALSVIRWKTVPYTVLRPLRLGAAMTGADDALLADLSRYAEAVGTGFQLRDDLLGALGDEAVTGKSGDSDLTEGKQTLLLALARDAADDAQRQVLDEVVGRADASPEELREVQSILRRTGAVDRVHSEVRSAAAQAEAALEEASGLDAAAVPGLRDLARAATNLDGLD
ncbi:MAG: polyprenyl synthetase family protein [Brachybacterium sp.]|nr:polyprenyl synthetase family protein [Brachybacterium sp.]